MSVVAPVGDDVEGIGDRDDSGGKGNAPAAQPPGVSAPVPPLVMRHDAASELGIEWLEWREHVGAAQRVSRDRAAFGRRQLRAVVEHIEERLVDLADIVKKGDALERAQLVGPETGGVAEDEGEASDASNVLTGLVVVGFDGVEESLEGGGGESFGPASSTVFEGGKGAGDECGGNGSFRSHWAMEVQEAGPADAQMQTRPAARGVQRASFDEAPATAYSPAVSRPEYHRRCQA
jgi:hypothetical protein